MGKKLEFRPIGLVRTETREVPHSWKNSEVEGKVRVYKRYEEGIKNISPGEEIVLIFYFHKSRPFTKKDIKQHPRGDKSLAKKGVFSLCSPLRPNAIGMSVVKVTALKDNEIYVKGLDILDKTPILDIKPYFK